MTGLLLDITTSPATEAGAVDFSFLFLKMMAALIVVCVLALVILKYVVPRMGYFRKFTAGRTISIVARQSLDHKNHLYIVRVGAKYALVGSSERGLKLIMELKKEDVEDKV